ncbi:P protein [Melipona quadrifasciata]|uniref:P protein n=1 Tax=Melipona quadrifasciata TaxID=166423 RepID=A0A0M9A7B8_9HYME|nr:P protein [Melipona quadrifasciata]
MAADFADEEFVKVDENDYDIIIIGAGLSGLTCAYHILRKQIGLDVLVIEANGEVGGRILQKSFNNTYHANSLQKHVTDLVAKLNIKTDQISNAETRQKILYTNNAALRILPKFYGAEVYDFFQTDGMSKITQTLLKYILQQDGEIRYVEPVNKVTLNNDRAYVSTGRNDFRCELVVVAVPPSVQSTITIEPSLSPTNIETLYAPAENVFFNLVYKKPSSSSNSVKDIVTIWDSSNNLNIIYDATRGNTKELVLAGFLAEPNLTQTHKKGLFTTLCDCYETFEPSAILRYKEHDQSLINDEINPGCPMSVLKPVSITNFTNHTEASYESNLAVFQREYDRVIQTAEGRSSDRVKKDCLVVNMSLGTQPALLQRQQNKKDVEDKQDTNVTQETQETKQRPVYRYIKLILLCCFWLIFTLILMIKSEKIEELHQISIPSGRIKSYKMFGEVSDKHVNLMVEGSLLPPIKYENVSDKYLMIWLELLVNEANNSNQFLFESKQIKNITDIWVLPILPENLMDIFPGQRHQKNFNLDNVTKDTLENANVVIKFKTNLEFSFAVSISYDISSISKDDGIVYAAVVHRTLAAMLASTMSIAILAILNERPTMNEVMSWIDVDTLLLLFSMMILVGIIAETGIFDWLAVYAYKITAGKLWPLIGTLCFFTTFISSFLDNVTTVLLMTPVTIRLCEVMEINPVPILTAMVIYSNIGGALTPVGDPPNVIIASNRDVINNGIDFSTFTIHMSIGVVLVIFIVFAQLKFIFRDIKVLKFAEPRDVHELRHEIAIWQRAAASLSSYSKDENVVRETLLKKVQRLLSLLKKKLMTGSATFETYKTTLDELQEKYPIRDKWLLVKSGFTLIFVIALFFLHSFPNLHLSLGWTALLGVLLLLILADSEDLDGLMARVEWSTLLFFASLFILMEALSRLGLIAWIGKQTEKIILSVDEESRLAVAILLLLWVSAFASAFVDNVPLSTMMIRIVTTLAQNNELKLTVAAFGMGFSFWRLYGR